MCTHKNLQKFCFSKRNVHYFEAEAIRTTVVALTDVIRTTVVPITNIISTMVVRIAAVIRTTEKIYIIV